MPSPSSKHPGMLWRKAFTSEERHVLNKEENELLTQTGPGTPGGDLMRRYWQPVALEEELPPGSPPIPVRLLSEDLVLFRDEDGKPGLLGIHCSHRGADLSYGRLEDGGLRCIYHGWLYDVAGRCLEQPGEPAGSTFQERNYLQGNEGNIDPAHQSFLHRLSQDSSDEHGVRQVLNTRAKSPTIET